jgi:hypothetical protein
MRLDCEVLDSLVFLGADAYYGLGVCFIDCCSLFVYKYVNTYFQTMMTCGVLYTLLSSARAWSQKSYMLSTNRGYPTTIPCSGIECLECKTG